MREIRSYGSGEGPGEGNRPAYSTSHFFAPPLLARGAGGASCPQRQPAKAARSSASRGNARSGHAA